MEYIKNLIHNLIETETSCTPLLQQINEAMLTRYKLLVDGWIEVIPKEVEIFYVNQQAKTPYVDTNMHCMLDARARTDIWNLQSNRFGQLYFHIRSYRGIEICLSDGDNYALCCVLKAAEVNGVDIWNPTKVYDAVFERICEHEGLLPDMFGRIRITARINQVDSVAVLLPREQAIENESVYHLPRKGLRRKDDNVWLPLRSLIDIWNPQLQMGNVQRINLYMKMHPRENVVDVMRRQKFQYVPAEIKIQYKLGYKVKLYD